MSKIKRFICLMLVCCIANIQVGVYEIFATDSVVDTSEVSNDDTVLDVYEYSYLNLIGKDGTPFESKKFTDESTKVNSYPSFSSVSSNMTWYTLDGKWCITAKSNASAVEIISYSYQGTDLSVVCDMPDIINFNFISKFEKVEDEDGNFLYYDAKTSNMSGLITSISNAFNVNYDKSTCTSLDLVVPKRVTAIAGKAFYNNTRLTSVQFEGDIQSIGSSAFEGCTRLKTLDLTGVFQNVATNTIPDRCFYKCSSLEIISVPETILNIGKEAFYQCDKIDYLVLPKAIKTIGSSAFAMCSNLRYLYIESDYSNWSNVVDSTESYKLVTEQVKETPLVSKKGDSSILGKFIYGITDVAITSKVDIDLDSVSVEKDGVSIPVSSFENDAYGYKTIGAYFSCRDKGNYTISAKDILGNELSYSFGYISDVVDTEAPVINIEGKGTDGFYQSVVITYSDKDTYVSSVEFDGVVVSDETITCDVEGEHKIVVRDTFGNEAKRTFMIDKTVPVIKGIDNDGVYKTHKNITITENGSGIKSIVLDDVEVPINNSINVYDTGKHTLVVTDNALNSVEYSFVIDLIEPQLDGISNKKVYNTDVKLNLISVCGIKSAKVDYKSLDGSVDTSYIESGEVLSKEGSYTVTLVNILGVSAKYTFIIDKISPEIDGVINGGYYNKEKLSLTIEDENLDTVTINGRTASKTISVKEDGKYTVVAVDKGGNKTTVSFVKDTVSPSISGVSNDKKYKKSVTVNATDNIGVDTIKLNGKLVDNRYKVSKSGSYKLVVNDKAGNSASLNFIVDTVSPTSNIKNNKSYKKSMKIVVTDDYIGIKSIKLNGKTIKNGYKVTDEGKYTLVTTDNLGNKCTTSFKFDRTKPTCNITNKAIVKQGKKIKVSDKLSGIKSIRLNNKKIKNNYKLTKKGSYTLKVTDKAGNKLTVKFTVK